MSIKKQYRKASVPIVYQKSNMIINAIGKPSATSQKLMNMALSCVEIDPTHSPQELEELKVIQKETKVDYSTGIVSVFKQDEFLKLIPGRNSKWNRTRDVLCSKSGLIQEFTMNIMGKDGKYSGATALITGTYYDPDTKKIYVKFQDSEEMRAVFTDIKYTTRLKLDTITRFKISYSIRIYELLESSVRLANWEAKRDKKEPKTIHEFVFGTERLKWTIGYCYPKKDLSTYAAELIQDKVSKCKTDYDFERIYLSHKSELSGTRWADFERDVLSKAIDELNNNAIMTGRKYSYEPIKDGGKRYKYIKFTVEDISNDRPITLNTDIEVIADPNKDKAIESIKTVLNRDAFFGKYFSDSDCYTLFKEANGDYDRVEKAYDAFIQYAKSHLQSKGDKIKPLNLMISLIKKNAEQNQEITYEDYYAANAGDASIDEEVRTAKRLIKKAGYEAENLIGDEKLYVNSMMKYLCVDIGISSADREKYSLDDICKILKRLDDYKESVLNSFKDDGNGQLRFEV